jgi:hypothetical protein
LLVYRHPAGFGKARGVALPAAGITAMRTKIRIMIEPIGDNVRQTNLT